MNNKAIGIFDSGIGGLTVYNAIKQRMPREKLIYFGDTARLPYGTKSSETIIKYSMENAQFLLKKEVKIIIVACNSSSSYSLPFLQDKLSIPVVGVIEPGAEAAVKLSKKKIGVIGTTATIASKAYEKAILTKKPDAEVISKDCPLLVSLVEEGWINHEVTRLVIEEYLLPLKEKAIDILVLGCTHYPVLKDQISDVIGKEIRLIDSGETTSKKVYSVLKNRAWLSASDNRVEDEFYVSDFPERFKNVGEIFLKRKLEKVNIAEETS